MTLNEQQFKLTTKFNVGDRVQGVDGNGMKGTVVRVWEKGSGGHREYRVNWDSGSSRKHGGLSLKADAPYANPGKCEGTSRNPDHVGGRPFQGPAAGRCQRPPTHWSEEKYAWLCDHHDRGRK